MLIGSGVPLSWYWKVHEYRGDMFFGLLIASSATELHIFD
jgi:hypothetical protein